MEFEHLRGANVLTRRRHWGPLRVQRPFRSGPGQPCQVIVLHPPGGIVGGDRLSMDVSTGAHAQALITTPGATKFYRSPRATALQRTTLRVGPAGLLEWLPQETLLFDGTRSDIETRVQLAPGAQFLGWEITGLGLPESGRRFERGTCRTRWEIRRNDKPLWIDRMHFRGGDERLEAAWGLAGHSVAGTLIFVGGTPACLEIARSVLAERPLDGRAGATRLGDVLVCRALAVSTRHVLELFSAVRDRLRCTVLNAPAPAPRIWST